MYGYLLGGAFGIIFGENIKFSAMSARERAAAWWVFDIDTAGKKFAGRVESGVVWLKQSHFAPRYDETTLFLLAVATLLTGVWYKDFLRYLLGFVARDGEMIIGVLFFVWGLWLSLYHAFSHREKTKRQKTQMAFFAAIVNILVALAMYDTSSHQKSDSLYIKILPAWHLASALYLLILLRLGVIGAESVDDQNAKRWEIGFGLVAVVGIFFLSAYYFENHWAVTLSLCVAYASTLNRAVKSLIILRAA